MQPGAAVTNQVRVTDEAVTVVAVRLPGAGGGTNRQPWTVIASTALVVPHTAPVDRMRPCTTYRYWVLIVRPLSVKDRPLVVPTTVNGAPAVAGARRMSYA